MDQQLTALHQKEYQNKQIYIFCIHTNLLASSQQLLNTTYPCNLFQQWSIETLINYPVFKESIYLNI